MPPETPPGTLALRRILLRVPGMRLLAELLRPTPGSWLYRPPISAWLSDDALVSQLPASYRLFARYCSAQRGARGSEVLLRCIIGLRRLARMESVRLMDISGVPIFVDLSDPRFLAVPRELRTGLPRILKIFLRPGDTFVDIGANHGTFSVTAARLVAPDGLVVAIEPQPGLADLIQRSLMLYAARSVVHNVACGDAAGTANLFVPRASSGSSGLHAAFSAVSRHQIVKVPVARLDDLLQPERLPGRVLVKLDIEGNEHACLTGARDFLVRVQPPILMEVNRAALKAAGSSPAALIEALRGFGYDRYLSGADLDQERTWNVPIANRNIIALPQGWRDDVR